MRYGSDSRRYENQPSSGFLDQLYKVRDEIRLIVNPEDFSLKSIEKDVLEGNWEQYYNAEIDSNFNIVTKDRTIENDKLLLYEKILINKNHAHSPSPILIQLALKTSYLLYLYIK